MRAWRVYQRKHPDPLSGKGAEMYGGRWNPRGVPALYLADSAALAMLEVLVRAPTLQHQNHYIAAEIEVDGRRLPRYPADHLPEGWDDEPAGQASQIWGKQRFEDGLLGFRVPSVVVPIQTAIVLSPRHPEFSSAVEIVREAIPFPFDRRLLADPKLG